MNILSLQLRALVNCFSSQKIKYAIIGGIAVSIYGEPRFTADIDVNIILDKRDISKFISNAKKNGLYPTTSGAKGIAQRAGIIPMEFRKGKIVGKIDIIIAENPLEHSAIKRAKTQRINSVKTRLISPEDLIIHKISSQRARDIEDIRGVLIRQKGKLDLKYIQYWLGKIDKVNRGLRLYKLFKKLLRET